MYSDESYILKTILDSNPSIRRLSVEMKGPFAVRLGVVLKKFYLWCSQNSDCS